MKNLTDMMYESTDKDVVYAIYLEDGTLYNYYDLESDAKKEADSLNKESKCNGAQVNKEPRENFEK